MARCFVIAMEKEAEAVRPALRPGDRLVVSGVGKVNAAAATQKAIDEGADEIWNAGLAGGFDPEMEVGDVVGIDAAVQYDFDLAELNQTCVGQLEERTSPFFEVANPLKGPKRRVLMTGDRFCDDETDLSLFRELGASVRDMEGAAIAHVCERNGVPCHLVKCISDIHGKGGMIAQYQVNQGRALECLKNALISLM